MFKVVLVLIAVQMLLRPLESARILGIVPSPSYSHQIVFQALWKELLPRGHHLTVLTTNTLKDQTLTNLTEIDLHFTYKLWNENYMEMFKFSESTFNSFRILTSIVNEITDRQLQHPLVRQLIKNESEHFDLVIGEPSGIMLAFSIRFNCPSIGMLSMNPSSLLYEIMGNPVHPVLYPDLNLPFITNLTFFQRMTSALFQVGFKLFVEFVMIPVQEEIIERHFDRSFPRLIDLLSNMSMLFINSDNVFHQIRPLTPNVVKIGGGIHQHPAKPLPRELQKLLDGATQGFIYFSLGSNVKSTDLSEATQRKLLEVFADLPYMVLWKFEIEDMTDKPKNVILSKWFPQQDIMRHPNIKLFITQGGHQSIEEAIYNHIPIIGMPFYGDQLSNVKMIEHKGLGISVSHEELNKESFKKAIFEIIENPIYRNRVKELAVLAEDQLMTGLEQAVWWTEYVIRHKGASHLKSPAVNLPTYQYYLIDVIGFCLLVIVVVVWLLILMVKLIFRLVKRCMTKSKIKVQ